MSNQRNESIARVRALLNPFCTHRGYSSYEFVEGSLLRLGVHDASDFCAALDANLVVHDKGTFRAALSKAKEQIFWEGRRKILPRRISLWLEPVITIAGLKRLCVDFGWPKERVGLQSKTWAFDLVGYSATCLTELLVCEVKKNIEEIERLVELMKQFGASPANGAHDLTAEGRNALKKVDGLRRNKPPVFWALGPENFGYVFEVTYDPTGKVAFTPSDERSLAFKRFPQPIAAGKGL